MIGPVHFIENKYRALYFRIVDRARSRALAGPGEWHHVLPRSLGGLQPRRFCVGLTHQEHFLCHWLLTKFTSGKALRQMGHALGWLRSRHGRASWRYARAREAKRVAMLGYTPSEKTRAKLRVAALGNQHFLGKTHSAVARAKISHATRGNRRALGRRHTVEARERIRVAASNPSAENREKKRIAALGNSYGAGHNYNPSVETREKLRVASLGNSNSLGYKHTEETRENMRVAAFHRAPASAEARENMRVAALGNQNARGRASK